MSSAAQGNNSIHKLLLEQFNKQFQRSYLEKNKYYVYKLTTNLGLKVQDIANERTIKSITTSEDQIIKALQECEKVKYLEKERAIIIRISPKKNKIRVTKPKAGDFQEFRSFIEDLIKSNELQANVVVDSTPDNLIIVFSDDNKALEFPQILIKNKFKGQDIEQQEQVENVQKSLQQSVKELQKQNANSQAYNPFPNGQSNGDNKDQQAQFVQQQMFMQQFLIQQQAMLQATQGGNFHHVYQSQDFSDLYIRRARDDAKKQAAASQHQQKNMMQAQYQQMQMMYNPMMYAPYNGMPPHQQSHQQNHRGRSQGRKKSSDRPDNRNHSQKRDHTKEKQQNQDREDNNNNYRGRSNNLKDKHQKKNKQYGKSHNNKDNVKSKNTKRNESENGKDVYVQKMNRPRIDSQNFPVLYEKNETGEKTPIQYVMVGKVPNCNPPEEPYVETRTKINKKYSRVELTISFDRWKISKSINPNLEKFLDDQNVPILNKEPITELEWQQPFRKNSSAITPLLTPMYTGNIRKGSGNYKTFKTPSLSPGKVHTRKWSYKK